MNKYYDLETTGVESNVGGLLITADGFLYISRCDENRVYEYKFIRE